MLKKQGRFSKRKKGVMEIMDMENVRHSLVEENKKGWTLELFLEDWMENLRYCDNSLVLMILRHHNYCDIDDESKIFVAALLYTWLVIFLTEYNKSKHYKSAHYNG